MRESAGKEAAVPLSGRGQTATQRQAKMRQSRGIGIVSTQMKSSDKATPKGPTAKQQLESLIAKVDGKHRDLLVSVRKALARRFPTANELVYDYPRALVIGYSPNENGIEAVVALSANAEGLRLYFLKGPKLPDPTGSLLGSGKQTRYIEVDSLATLKRPEVEAFLKAVVEISKTPLSKTGGGQILIKTSVSKKAAKPKVAKVKGKAKAAKPKAAKKKAARRP